MTEHKTLPNRMYDLPAGHYCGVIMPEHVMKRIMRAAAKYSNEVKKILNDHKAELHSSQWTGSYRTGSDGKITEHVKIHYVLTDDQEVERRIALFKPGQPTCLNTVYVVNDYKEAQAVCDELLEDLGGSHE
jgi:hypothetical protein